MCCDGVLFHSVELQERDSARLLAAKGIKIRSKKGQAFFLQPCSAHQNCSCVIYEDRPARCRLFNCRQLVLLEKGETTKEAALEKIREARQRVEAVNGLINQITETNPNRSLAQRCANALTTPEPTPLHQKLEFAMAELESHLEKNFRVPEI
jgi:hypothetical protein